MVAIGHHEGDFKMAIRISNGLIKGCNVGMAIGPGANPDVVMDNVTFEDNGKAIYFEPSALAQLGIQDIPQAEWHEFVRRALGGQPAIEAVKSSGLTAYVKEKGWDIATFVATVAALFK
jgi:hypothetical protein